MTDTAVENVEETAEDQLGGENGSDGLAKKLLIPAAAGVGTLAATVAARKAPDLIRDKVVPMLENKGTDEAAKLGQRAAGRVQGQQGGIVGMVAGKAREKLSGAGGKEKTRRLPIQRWTDIARPVDEVYQKWMDFEEYPKFMHRVVSVEKQDTNTVTWAEKIWFSTRQWEGEITDRRKNDRIAWKTVSGTSHSGVVSFHKLDTNLTRVMVDMEFRPGGMIEKMASGLRFVKRAVQADLARFKAYCEFDDAKGLEYEQPDKNEKKDEDDDEQPRAESEQKDADSGSNGDSSDEEREQSRKQRAERREERRA